MSLTRRSRILGLSLLTAAASCVSESDAAGTREAAIVRRAREHGTSQGRSAQGTTPAPFVQHPDYIQPGITLTRPFTRLVNPYEGDKQRIAAGGKLYVAYNCIDCHGADGAGAMAPSLADGRWHFGGTPGEVFQSIYEGRPDGMPSWGGRISDVDIWTLVSYVKTLDAGKNVATENFTGKTKPAMGH